VSIERKPGYSMAVAGGLPLPSHVAAGEIGKEQEDRGEREEA